MRTWIIECKEKWCDHPIRTTHTGNFEREDIIELMKQHTVLTEELYKRRAQTVVKWVNWIDVNFPDFREQ